MKMLKERHQHKYRPKNKYIQPKFQQFNKLHSQFLNNQDMRPLLINLDIYKNKNNSKLKKKSFLNLKLKFHQRKQM